MVRNDSRKHESIDHGEHSLRKQNSATASTAGRIWEEHQNDCCVRYYTQKQNTTIP